MDPHAVEPPTETPPPTLVTMEEEKALFEVRLSVAKQVALGDKVMTLLKLKTNARKKSRRR